MINVRWRGTTTWLDQTDTRSWIHLKGILTAAQPERCTVCKWMEKMRSLSNSPISLPMSW